MHSDSCTAVLLDPHPLWMSAVENTLARLDVTVLGKATVSSQAVSLLDEHRPDLLIVEITTPDALACLADALRRYPDLRAIVLSASSNPDDIDEAFRAGAAAYVVKTVQPEDLASTVRQAFDPSVYLAAGARSVVRDDPRPEPVGPVSVLTKRETEILRLVADGRSNGQVARLLWVTEQTVKFHLSNIYRKLDVGNRTEASRWAQVNGLLDVATVDVATV
jgi:DNA-binding NarL/FixJ family response regulator